MVESRFPCSTDYNKDKIVSVDDWLNECVKKGLNCVVITDHNDTGWIDNVTDTLVHLKKEIIKFENFYIFKGLELTVDEIHFILIFKDTMKRKNGLKLILKMQLEEN